MLYRLFYNIISHITIVKLQQCIFHNTKIIRVMKWLLIVKTMLVLYVTPHAYRWNDDHYYEVNYTLETKPDPDVSDLYTLFK